VDSICKHVINGFRQSLAKRRRTGRRIGAELKFPLVRKDGSAASLRTVCALWEYLGERGWQPVEDALTGNVVGAEKAGEQNNTVASCETGYCKLEFSLAHVGNIFDLEASIDGLTAELEPFCRKHGVFLLGYGIQPVTPPSKKLLMKKGRTSVWHKVFGSNRHIPEEAGDDVHLFTINAPSHVHVSVSQEEAIPAVNVLNGFAGAQIALTANSSIWQGKVDPKYRCVAEKLWDWWMPDADRVGVPARPFEDIEDYVRTIAAMKPVFVKRRGKPVVLASYDTFEQYYNEDRAVGTNSQGRQVAVRPRPDDIDVHSTCYWYDARISRYYTVENRANDQQPPQTLASVAALTLGLVTALPEAQKVLARYEWDQLRKARELACRHALGQKNDPGPVAEMAQDALDMAWLGLRHRGLGEEKFLEPLENRLEERKCPADEAEEVFRGGGIEALVAVRSLWM